MEHGWMQPGLPLDENDKQRLILKLIARLRCPECGRIYDREDFALTDRLQDAWVLSTRCRHCEEVVHVVVLMRLDALPESAVDLTPEELEKVSEWPPISADDVLDVHAALGRFDGDFQSLFP